MLVFSANGRVRQIPGNYSDYLETMANEAAQPETAPLRSEAEAPSRKRSTLSYNEKKELEGMEAAIATKEGEAMAAEAAPAGSQRFRELRGIQGGNRKTCRAPSRGRSPLCPVGGLGSQAGELKP